MKEKLTKHLSDSGSLIYKTLNALLVGSFLYVVSNFIQITSRETSDYFVYKSITPVEHTISGGLYFLSDLERHQESNMRFNDTLFCGWGDADYAKTRQDGPPTLFWYSQESSEYKNAPAGKFKSKWKYNGEIPTIPMVCQLRSSPAAEVGFGFVTKPQKINTDLFLVE